MKFGERYTPSEMDEYDKKFAEMQKYIPFLEAMIERLQNVKDKSREIQLQKMQSLHGILSNSKRKLKIETLQRCEDVLQKLHNKVEKGNTPGLHFPNKKGESNSMQSSAVSENTNVDQSKIVTISQKTEETTETIDIHETPASPSPPVSPDSGSQVAPIIIPTERSVDFIDDKSDSKPASPDPVETLPTKAPIIIPTERTSSTIILSPSSNFSLNKNTDDTSFSEWEMLEESEAQNTRNKIWQNVVPSHHDVNNSTKLGGANWTQKINDKRSHVSSRHIPTVPVPSLGVSRRLPLVAEKSRLSGRNVDVVTSDSRPESPINSQDVKLKSPESEMLFPKHKSSSPRLKEGHGVPKTSSKPSAPLLLSPPPVSTEPPLSMEDLAELLNEEGDSKTEKKNDRSGDEAAKLKKDTCKQELTSTCNKDTKGPKPFLLTQDDIDRESERRWEEVDKHIVKLTSRKCLPISVSASLSAKVEPSKSSETKGPQSSSSVHNPPSFSINVEKVTDNRSVSSSPSSKAELRYADNYERHPRHSRENHGHDNVKDKINPNSHCRQSDDDMGNAIPVLHSGLAKPDDRSNALYQRRQPNVVSEAVPPRIDTEFRVEGPDYFNRQVPNPNHWPPMHPPVNTNEFGNNQWIPPNNFVGMPNTPPQPPHPYPHPMGMHQEMWNMGAAGNTVHMDPHSINDTQLRPNQMPPNINTAIRPLMSPTARPPDICHNSRPDNIREDLPNVNVSPIQPLISPTGFPVGPQYRNFQPENRPYEPVFERGMEYPHVRPSWEQQPGRTNDIPYRGENEVPCGIIGPDSLVGAGNSYPRPSTPCPWNRDRDRSNRGRGRDTYYNDRNRGEIRNNFNRDSRRPEWTRDNHTEWDNCNRFNRDSRNISDRDPRVRIEHGAPNQNQNQSRDNNSTSARDPRLAKDKHLPAPKGKETSYNERDPRKRQVPPPLLLSPRKTKEKPKSPPKSFDNHKRSDGESNRHPQDKIAKDKMQSPLESLYGVIDTKAKSAQGYCLQNFKIPKIKRTEPSVSPTPSPTSEELKVSEIKSSPEKQEEKVLKIDDERQHQGQSIDKDDTTAEVSSSSDGQIVSENWNREDTSPDKKVDIKEDIVNVETTEEADKSTLKIGEADSHGIVSPKPSEDIEKPEKPENPETPEKPLTEVVKAETLKSKEEVTQEWIEALIRKSFEFGEGKKFVEQAKLMQKLGAVLQTKKLKKIKKIIESESESSSSDKDNCLEPKKTRVRRKRRVIVSDSSDEECLAERLGILNTITNKEEPQKTPCDEVANDGPSDTEKKEPLSSNIEDSKEDTKEDITTKTEDTVQEIIQDSSEDISHHLSENIAEKEELEKEETSNKDTENMEKEDTNDMNDTTPKDETVGDKDSISKAPKAKAKRRNSLEMLQEDIREMFISEGVVTATGYRMCRIQKESQNNVSASTSNQNALITKKDEPSSKRDGEATSDIEELPSISSKQKRVSKPRNTDESGKSKIKHKKEGQRVTRQRSKRYVQSSDSEEDQPLALRTELIQNSSIVSNEGETETHNEESETTPRRSKRVMYKEIIKESRVIIEKTDISKLECSKIMFDSSSDESFGIDVSELAAAVDISLHPEKQSEPTEVDTAEKRKSDGNTAKKTLKKKSKEPVAEDKPDDVIVLTDEESIISDISMSSSVTSGKKMTVGATKMETSNEELLSNILVGLVPTKRDLEKDTRTADKGSDADVDDDTSDQLPVDQNVKKTSVKRKKKKCNWQLGILSKKKRKRALTSCALKFEVDLNTSSEAEASLKLNNSSILGDSTNDGMDETSLDNTKETIGDKLDTTIKDIDHNEISKGVLNDQKLKVSPEVLNPSEESLCKSTSPSGELADAKNVQSNPCETDGITTKSITDNKKTEYDEAVENAFRNLEVKKLIDYAWTGKDRYKCLLCFFTGKNIVHHYKLNHPGKEILISRLKVADALLAIQDAKDNKLADVSVKPLTEDRKFNCRFCPFFTEGATKVAMEAFYEHCTTHTGEYRFQCNRCPYQAVAKSSMRTHYYKNCRLYNDTFSESITEDEIPQENCIYGYLCSTCNYVQLKENSLHKHLELWHANDLNTSIIKINMSFDAIKEKNEESATDQLGTDLFIDMEKPETSTTNKVMDSCEQNDDDDNDDNDGNGDDNDDRLIINANDNENENQDPLKDKQETAINSEKTSDHNNTELQREESVSVKISDEKQMSLQTDTEIPLPTEKLSAFVCPPELEKKEVEIQLERKRKMQEIIENIGIKLQKDAFKKRLSIIDKLQDKMKTDLPVGHNQNSESNLVADSSIKNSTSIVESSGTMVFQNNTTESLSLSGTVHSVDKTEINSLSKQEMLVGDKQVNNSILNSAQSLNIEPISPFTPQVQKLDAKLKDPLMTIDQRKNDESEIETSDNENVRNIAPIYESDSSSEQSDSELPTDVNMLLKETSSIAASSKDPMLTTIQRLAAQLQAAKPLEICNSQNSSKPKKAVRKASLFSHIPKPPNVIPIASIKKFVGKLDANYREVSSEHDDSNPPKNFIRLRRLSGDMLSMPVQNLDFQEDPLALSDESSCKASKKMETILQTDEEECSFLKIESVVSLAPRANNNDTESPIINDIRKAVETSPVKNKGVSILKKSNSPLILKRLNAVTITQPLTKNVQTMQPSTSETVKLIPVKSITSPSSSVAATQLGTNFVPIAPKSKIIQLDNKLSFPLAVNKTSVIAPVTTRTVTVTGSSTPQNLNYKIVKVLCAPTVLKPKDPQPSTMKLKSADAYNAMLKTAKLTHLYKCMARDCRYTTDVLGNYHQHYLQHMIETEKKKGTAPFDFQKCAYCYLVLNDWNKMKVHMEEKHAHCRYQCSYCFYRAIVPSYVQIHQTISHPGYHGILLGKLVKEIPLKEEINRHDYIRPFVCQHECGKFFYVPEAFAAHLKTKHHSLLLLFKCHLCAATCLKVDQLITHYKVHGFFKYQCLYCLNGSENFNDMFVHLSAFHCNRIPQVLERSLPPQPVRNKDVIEQLIVRTLDENIKSLELIEVDADVKGSIKTSNNNPDTDTFSIALADHGKIPSSENCNDISTIKISDITYDDSNMSASSTSSKQTTENISLSLPSTNTIFAFSDESLKDSLKLSEGFDCSDEFININLLDNPDFLKNADSQRNAKNTLSTCENKADDSDIEILDIQDSGSSSKKETKYLSDATKYPDSDTKEKRTSSMSKQKSGAEDQSGSCSGSKNTSTSNETNKKSADINVKPERPLTLEDIKDTGFTGTKLYKCGYEECFFGAPTPALLRAHVKECTHGGDNKNLNCAHCNKRFIKIGFLLEHLKLHGLKRFGCSLCKMRCTVGYQAMAHMKAKHKFTNSKLIPADPKNPSADGLFIVQPVNPSAERKGKKRKNAKSTEKEGDKDKLIDVEKLCFSPDEIDSLPRQAIYNREVQCAMCPYTTKVRTNIIRHLQLHAKDESVPESGPVNPVPCLDKKERMFDKMVNLASSSHQNGRMGAKAKELPKENDDEFIPKFVPENKRYVCSVAECNYLTVDEAMLRYHLKALHSDEPYFRCPHCPQPQPGQENLNIAIDKMGVHLKMHDTRLYKCSHCNHHHYHRHVVERHLSDKHPEKRPFVKVIRELESTENNQQTVQEEVEEEVPDPDGNHWKCNICEYKCVYKAEMVTHTTTAHDEKCQFKCTLCSFKTSGKIMFEQHINSKHSTEANVDYILIYQRIKGVNKKSTDNVEQSGQEEPFDTTPLWRRDMPRIRHIRGILLEEEDTLTESSVKPGKRKSENSDVLAVKPAKIKPGKSGPLDDSKQSKEKSKRSLSEKMPVDVENLIAASSIQKKCDTNVNADKSSKEPKATDADGNDLNDSDIGRFGPYGKPDGNMYVCTLCTLFKTKYKHDMRDHLYRELNYARWHCKECGYLSVNRNALLKHFNKHHQGGRPDHEPLSPDDDIEDWVCTLLKRQTCIMKGSSTLKRNNSGADISTSSSADISTPTVVDDKASVTKVPQNTPNKTFKTIDLTQKHPDLQDSTVQGTEIDINAHDDDSRDEAPLVIDLKEETQLKSEKNESLSEMEEGRAIAEGEQPKPFTCKHCKLIFTRWRGFKLHLHLTHLKRLGYLCPYCDRSTNSEALMRQHIRLKHPRCPEKIIPNPAAGGPELTDDFWQKEYGIVFPNKLSKKRKRASLEGGGVDNDNCDQSETQEKCSLCGFIAMNYAGLKDHMRIHEQKSLQCKHCTFAASTQAEMWDHWEINHPLLTFRFDDLSPPSSSSVEPKATQDGEKYNIDDYSDDIEEEYISDVRDELMYCCFYCPLRSKSLETVRHHWTVIHKDSKLSKDSAKFKGNLPFRYKELRVPVPAPQKSYKKAHSSENDSDSPYELYMQHSQNEVEIIEQSETKQEGWICQWCDEFCDSETKMKTHQNMFHSHLPLNFKRQGSNEAPKGYVCPECAFTTTFINTMKSHVSKHINIFKCKYCDRTFSTSTLVSSHTTDEHPGMEVKIESIQNYDVLVDKIMAKVKWYKSDERPADQKETVLNETSPKRHAVARKSTTKSTALAQSIPSKVKAVARKSTNPHSRYLSSGKFNEGDKPDEKLTKSKQYSYYGVPRSPINLTKLNTYMVVGGHRMKVNCTTLSQLININPKVVLKDLKNDIKNISVLSKLK